MRKLGKSILDKDPGAANVKDKLQKLGNDEEVIDQMWADRDQQLQHAYELQVHEYPSWERLSQVKCSSYCLRGMHAWPKFAPEHRNLFVFII